MKTLSSKMMLMSMLIIAYIGISYVYYRHFINKLWIVSIVSLTIWVIGELLNYLTSFIRFIGLVFVISFLLLMGLFIWELIFKYSDGLMVFISLYIICLGLINDIRRIKK